MAPTMKRQTVTLGFVLLGCASMATTSTRSSRPPDGWGGSISTAREVARSVGLSTYCQDLAGCEAAFLSSTTDVDRIQALEAWLTHMAWTAFEARHAAIGAHAGEHASEALRLVRSLPSDARAGTEGLTHRSHLLLGHLALDRGDRETARKELLAAADTAGTAVMSTFGPGMSLARELLWLGENGTVLEYFDACRQFWLPAHSELDQWKAEIDAGRVPDFQLHIVF